MEKIIGAQSEPTRQPLQARAVQTRATILDAAATVFAEAGYEAASLGEIVRRAEVTKGAMYFHFASKAELAREVLRVQTTGIEAPPADSPLQSLIDLSLHVAHLMQTDPIVQAGARLSLDEGTEDFSDLAPFGDWAGLCETLLVRGRSSGVVPAGVDPRETAELIVGAFTGLQMLSRIASDRADLPRRITSMWRHLLPAITTADHARTLLLDGSPGGASPADADVHER